MIAEIPQIKKDKPNSQSIDDTKAQINKNTSLKNIGKRTP